MIISIFFVPYLLSFKLINFVLYSFFFFQILDSEFVEGFYIYSRGLDPPARVTNMLTVLHAGEASGFLVTGLQKFTRYQFFLVPFYKTLDGRPSNSRAARTLEDGNFLKFLFTI